MKYLFPIALLAVGALIFHERVNQTHEFIAFVLMAVAVAIYIVLMIESNQRWIDSMRLGSKKGRV